MYSTFKKFCGGQVSTMAAAVLLTIAGQASAQTPEGALATHSAPLYLAGSTLDVSCTFTVPAGRHLQSLLWSPALPSGWTLVSVTGDGGPLIDSSGNFTFFGDLSASPVRFSYRVFVPSGAIGPKTLGGRADYQLDGMFNPEPVAVPPFTLSDTAATHSARGYLAGRNLEIECTVSYRAERQLQSLLWVPELPPNWKLVAASGQGNPEVDPAKGAITFFGDLSSNPVTFSYTVEVPDTARGTNSLGGRIDYQLDNMFNPVSTRVLPDPLRVPEMHTLHVASTHGVGLPTVGVYTNYYGTALTNRINASVVSGSRTFACSGWTLAGNEPLIGSGTECALTLTNNAVLTWVWVAPLISPAGTVSVTMDEDNAPLVWTQPSLSAVTTSDPAGQPAGTLSWSLKTQAAHGTATVSGTGATPSITYLPVTNWYGSDSFVVHVTDGLGGFDQATVSVTVNPVNDAPVLSPIGDKRTDERTPLTFAVAATDVDIPAQNLAYSLDAAARSAGMAINPTTGVFTWTPTAGQAGLDLTAFPVTVTVMDNGTGPANQSDSESFTITLDSSRATHAAVGYIADSTLTIDCAFAYPAGRQLQSLLWKPLLPAGWTLLGATGDGLPDVGSDGALVFGGGTLPNPVRFQYTVHVVASATGPQPIGGSAAYQLDGMFNPSTVRAQPDPLVVPMLLTLPNLVVADKVYDGTTNATVASYGVLAGVAGADQVTLVTDAARAFFDTPLAGSNKTVTVSGLTLSGANASWYAISEQTTTGADLAITPKALTVAGLTGNSKTYDGTPVATVTGSAILDGVVNPDDVTLISTPVYTFASKDVANGILITMAGYTLGGAQAGNYSLTLPTLSGNITPATLTVTANNKSRAYGEVNPTLTAMITGYVNGENLETSGVTGTAGLTTLADAASTVAGSPYTITCGVGTLAAANYSFTFFDGTLTVARATLTIGGSFTVRDKWYDATTVAEIEENKLILLAPIAGDDVTLMVSARFLTPDVGVDKPVVLSTSTLGGGDAANYALSLENLPAGTGTITMQVTLLGTPVYWYQSRDLAPLLGDDWNDVDYYDADGDRMLNWQEYVAGTDPKDAVSLLKITLIQAREGQLPHLEWIGGTLGPKNPYIIESTGSLVNPDWQPVGQQERADGLNAWTGGTPVEAQCFFRIVANRD